MSHLQHRRKPSKLRIEHHTITIHYLSSRSNTSFPACTFVPPGALRRYRQSKGSFTLSWKILASKLKAICEFDEAKHVLVCSRGGDFAARIVRDERGLNRAFREQIAWFRESTGDGNVVFWACREGDLEVGQVRGLERNAYLQEAGDEVWKEDGGGKSEKLVEVVGSWSEGVEATGGVGG